MVWNESGWEGNHIGIKKNEIFLSDISDYWRF